MRGRLTRWAPLTIALLALASSAIGIFNGFTYDDRYIVAMNPAMHDLAHWWRAFTTSYWPREWGGDGYRPLTMLLFRVEHALGRGSPLPFHALNIALYAFVAAMVFLLARRLLPVWGAWLVAALFAVHPVHVEAVANVVGQSELLVAAALLPAIILYLRDRQNGPLQVSSAAAITVLYLIGCLAKEHAIVLPAILVAAELTVLDGAQSIRERLADKSLRVFYLTLALVAVAFVAGRSVVLADHGLGGFQPFTPFSSLRITSAQRMLTAVGVVPEWLRLFYWPVRLSSEYGPPDIEIAQGIEIWQLPGFLLLGAVLGIGLLLRRRNPVISFGIAFACIALLPSSNFLVPAGIVLAERTLFLPSVGAMIVVGGAAMSLARRYSQAALRPSPIVLSAVALLLAAGIARSASRSLVWKDNDTLFRQAVVDSPLSYRAHYMLGAWHFENRRKRDGETEYRRALNLFPYDPFVSYTMAEQYRKIGLCAPAVPLYKWTRGLDPDFPLGRAAYAECLLNTGDFEEARRMAYAAISVGGDLKQARRILFLADSGSAADAAKAGTAAVASTMPVGQAGARRKLR